ncbi:MAG: hypothetical protein IKV26_09470 [Paludibacteraceae bacterium]|nr:hypothetical protein [Paludibacteraceae bacterium]
MKKLFLSLFSFAILLAFVACETTPIDSLEKEMKQWEKVEPNCYLFSASKKYVDFGNMYTIQLMSNGLAYENKVWKGEGDFLTLSLYANPLNDGFPVNKKYNFVAYEEVSIETKECLVGGYLNKTSSGAITPMGTFAYDVDEVTQTAGGLVCTGGSVIMYGNCANAKIVAVLDFYTATGETVQREYIFSGPININ